MMNPQTKAWLSVIGLTLLLFLIAGPLITIVVFAIGGCYEAASRSRRRRVKR